ncbi:MAG: FtsX-like permease family protein, partial [Dehalococcoidia bacterium]
MGPRSFLEFVGRRTRSHWPMLTVVSVGVVAAVVTIAASVIYFDSLGDIALKREISTDTGASHDIVITGREVNVNAASNAKILDLVDVAITDIVASIITDSTLAYGSPTLLVEELESTGSEIDPSLRSVLINSPELQANSVLTAGSWPSNLAGEDASGRLLIEVALEEGAAEAFDISVGDTIVVAPFWSDVNDSIAVSVTGTFARGQADPGYWRDLDDQFGLDDSDLAFLPLVPDSDVFVSIVGPYLPAMTVRYFWRFRVDSDRVNASGAKKLLLGFEELKARLQPKIGKYSQQIPLQDVLERNQQQTFFSRLPMTVVFSVIAAVVLYFVGTMSILMVETQRDDIARLRTRAATAKQVIGAFVIEGAVVGLLAILLAPPLAALLVKWLGVIPLFADLNGGNPLPVTLGQSAYLVSILTGIAGFLAMVIPASMAAKRTVVSSVRETTRPAPQSAMQKYYLDIALLGLLLVFASQLASEGSFVDVPGVGAAQVDRINVAMPALVLAFGGFVALRAFPVMVELVARVTSLPRISGLVSPAITLVLWQMARNPRHYSRLSLLMILTAGLGVFASSFAGTLDVSAADRARYQSGADLRVNGVSYTNRVQAGETFKRIGSTPGVESAAPAFRAVGVDLTADVGSTFTYLGVDPVPMAGIAWTRDDFSSTSLDEQMSRLTESRTGILIPPDARWITAKVRPKTRRADSRIAARLSDSTGRLFTLNLGSLLPRPSAGNPFKCDVAQAHLPPNWCTIAGSLDSIDFTGITPTPPLRLEFLGVGLPNVERGRFSRTDLPFLEAGSVEIDELGLVLESGESVVLEDFNEDSS